MVATLVQRSNAHVLQAEVLSLLAKGAVETVFPAQNESDFYSRYFLVPKMDGVLRPILDLRVTSESRPYETAIQDNYIKADPLVNIPRGLVLFAGSEDTYFHIQIAPHHRRFLGMVYRRKVVSTDASNLGWGALCDSKLAFGLWSKKEGHLYINCLEMLAVCLGLRTFLSDLRGHLCGQAHITTGSYTKELDKVILFNICKS